MSNDTSAVTLHFHPLCLEDKQAVQEVTLQAGRRNCNYSFANLIGWQFFFRSEVCILPRRVVLRYHFDNDLAYMVCSAEAPDLPLLKALCADAASQNAPLRLMGVEDDQAEQIRALLPDVIVEPRRSNYDYIYLRSDLAQLKGGALKAKRNHVNKFCAEHPHFEYRALTPDLFGDCRILEQLWRRDNHENPAYGDTLSIEQQVMEYVFAHWHDLDMVGGALFVDGRMVAFTYGSPLTHDTIDVCVEKADRSVDGAFSVINQQFVQHLPEQYLYVNREEDMGLEGLRKAKLSYHPAILLSYNMIYFDKRDCASEERPYFLRRCTSADAPETIDWITRQYGFVRQEVEDWVAHLHFNWPLSVKAVDRQGSTIGLLSMSDYRIEEETCRIIDEKPDLLRRLNALRYTAVFSFIVAEPYRHTRLNYDMMRSIWPDLQHYDFLFIPVMHHLQTHRYWQRWGAREFYRDGQSVYYMLPLTPAAQEIG